MNKGLLKMMAAALMMNYNDAGGESGAGGSGGGDESGDQENHGAYYEAFPEDVREWDEVKNAKTPEDFWKQMGSHRQHLGQSIRIPGPDAGEDDWKSFNAKLQDKVPTLMTAPNPEDEESINAFYTRMGKPETEEGYTIPEIKDSEGKAVEGIDHSMTETFKKVALANGLNQKQFTDIVNSMTAVNLAQAQAAQDNLATERAGITEVWGAAEDKNYASLANFAKVTDAPPEVAAAIEGKQLTKGMAEWMLKASKATFSSQNGATRDEGGGAGVMTPSEAAERHTEIMNNKKHPYWNKMDPAHKAAVARVRELIILKNPKTATNVAPSSSFALPSEE